MNGLPEEARISGQIQIEMQTPPRWPHSLLAGSARDAPPQARGPRALGEASALTLVAEVAPQRRGWPLSGARGLDVQVLSVAWRLGSDP